MNQLILVYISLVLSLAFGAGVLHLVTHLGDIGRKMSDWVCAAPGLDLVLAYFMLAPLALGGASVGMRGLGIALLAQFTTLWLWIITHEVMHFQQRHRAKIHRTMGNIAGKWQNHLAVWLTAVVIPIFWAIRLGEIFVYPVLNILVKFPKYKSKEWVNVSRHKFEGLVGYDLIWCLYCDWMTGVWSLGTEMLRNVESFWCPIRFYPEKKCKNCQIDFPDTDNGWISANGTIEDVTALLNSKYSPEQEERSWFGHRSRHGQNDSSREKPKTQLV